jgi:adenine-specific DNA-methyltransferase
MALPAAIAALIETFAPTKPTTPPLPRRSMFQKCPPMPSLASTEFAVSDSPLKPSVDKRELGQFFTPSPLADFIASFFVRPLQDWRVIDAGAGSGALTLALVRRVITQQPRPSSFHVTAYEIDPATLPLLQETLTACNHLCTQHGILFTSELRTEDFITHTTSALEQAFFSPALRTFNAAIVNPPYRKLSIGSPSHRRLVAVGIEVTNLYSGFIALLARLLEADAELVAIIPRSFCNGPYFLPFRHDFLTRMALRRLHVFESRTAAFANEAVLQENIILRADRTSLSPDTVEVSSSRGDFTDSIRSRLLPWSEICHPLDTQRFIRLPASDQEHAAIASLAGLTGTLADLGLTVSTGKVVDFRAREHLRATFTPGDYPLLYPCHFEDGALVWPKLGGKKPNGIAVPASRTDLLVPAATYLVVRRFSSKEERKRIVASLIDSSCLPAGTAWLGIENHLNYFHASGCGIPLVIARGLLAYLNWSVVDSYFRHFNGHTQVNATDLRSLPYPSVFSLVKLGEAFGARSTLPAQTELDALVAAHFNH